jgi:hypothetical protein
MTMVLPVKQRDAIEIFEKSPLRFATLPLLNPAFPFNELRVIRTPTTGSLFVSSFVLVVFEPSLFSCVFSF